jgi:hypothetical protein
MYRWVARNRNCFGRQCTGPIKQKLSLVHRLRWIVALLPTAVALSLGKAVRPWAWMWLIACALFLGAKWITIERFLGSGKQTERGRSLAYCFMWPGMDVQSFCGKRSLPAPLFREWLEAGAKTLVGAVIVWGVVPLTRAHPLFRGWLGMMGIVLLLHFGVFHLLSIVWRSVGINARPIMHAPAGATSLSGFWGGRWNRAFTDLMHENILKPLSRRIGVRAALFAVFLISGGLHELVISVPARGAYGLPTTYFVLQALGIFFERSGAGRRLGIGSGWRGWCFGALFAGAPAFWLFPPIFVHRVILPMLHAMGAG